MKKNYEVKFNIEVKFICKTLGLYIEAYPPQTSQALAPRVRAFCLVFLIQFLVHFLTHLQVGL